MGRKIVGNQIISGINEYLVNGIDMDIFGGNVFQVNIVNLRAVLYIKGHPRRSSNVVQRHIR
ncbi:hypothetical protein SDC9_75497 [bioreactor metagenome]|uniref:Uncharacterized protein n=1 Tax=bioreactor metagenome TaxID=1076179 RepID=A0A644YKV7_9ZZZZ